MTSVSSLVRPPTPWKIFPTSSPSQEAEGGMALGRARDGGQGILGCDPPTMTPGGKKSRFSCLIQVMGHSER